MLTRIVFLVSLLMANLSFAGSETCCEYHNPSVCLNSPGNDYTCYYWSKTVNGVFSEGKGNCTWYARYKRTDLEDIGVHDAVNWYQVAINNNFAVGNTPTKGSIVVFNYYDNYNNENYGHVAYVENVDNDEDDIPTNNPFNVTEMGYSAWDGVHEGAYQDSGYELGGIIGFIYPVGIYDNLSHNDDILEGFLNAYNNQDPKIGWPHNNGGDVFVHKWESNQDSNYRIWLQDFIDEDENSTALVLNEYLHENKAYLLKGAIRDFYMNNDGPFNYGMPFTDEITHGYADGPYIE